LTGNRISEETLKRIFGKRRVLSENYRPQAYSLMVLQKFALTIDSRERKPAPKRRLYGFSKSAIIWGGALSVALLSVFLFFFKSHPEGEFLFSCENPKDTIPFTANFKYDIQDINDSVFSDFGNNEEIHIPKGKSMITYFYQSAGIHTARFYTRRRMLDSLNVFAWSRDWQGGYFPNLKQELYTPFQNQRFYRQHNFFYASPDELKNEKVEIMQKDWTTYRFFSPFQKSLDNLTLATRVMNNASTGSLTCYDIEIILVGDSGNVDLKFTQPKCSRYASLKVSERYLDGKFSDLSAFTVDMSDWLQVKLVTKENNAQVYLDEKLIFSQKYEKKMGQLLGVVYQFFGSGKIDYLELSDAQQSLFYVNDF
jgi:hypothetical protein